MKREEMVKDGLLIKGMEGENHKELNWSKLKITKQVHLGLVRAV